VSTVAAGDAGLVEIRIVGLPIELYVEASRHHEELRREFLLIASSASGGESSKVPARLLALIQDLEQRFQAFTAEPQTALSDAVEKQAPSVDLVYRLPAEVGPAAAEFDVLLDEADAYCREGATLLTLATSPEALAFRRWFLQEFVRQAAGDAPQPWSEFPPAAGAP